MKTAHIVLGGLTLVLLTVAGPSIRAEVVEVVIESREDVLDGSPFGAAGAYEKIVGRIRFEFDPENSFNGAIIDLGLAARNGDGRVEAWSNFMVLQPKDPALRRGVAWVEVSNRGGKASLSYFNAAIGSRNPVSAEHFGDGLLLRQGLTIVWVGWQWDMAEGEHVLRLDGPVLTHEDGTPITGLVRSDWTVDEASDVLALVHGSGQVPYPLADPDTAENVLTVRDGRDAPRRVVPRSRWHFVPEPVVEDTATALERADSTGTRVDSADVALPASAGSTAAEGPGDAGDPAAADPADVDEPDAAEDSAETADSASAEDQPSEPAEEQSPSLTHIQLDGGFEPGRIYELVYLGQDPRVVGLGLAAIRDVISYAKYDPESVFPVETGVAFGVSQTGRFLRHFLYQGFNVDEEGRKAYDGLLVHTAGAGRGSFNHRFGQPSRDAHRYSAFFYPTDLFPFTSRQQTDRVTDQEDGLLSHLAPEHQPVIFYTNTGYEYWGRAAALIHHSVDGSEDIEPLANERIYHLTSGQHTGSGMMAWRPDTAERMSGGVFRGNPLDYLVNLRALAVALVDWAADGTEPPVSRYPTVTEGTLIPFDQITYPNIPGLVQSRVIHTAYRTDYGEEWDKGIVLRQPPRLGSTYPSLVSDVDAYGNEIAGIRPIEVRVPLGTYLPWNLRAGYAGGTDEMVGSIGSYVPFPATQNVGRIRADPRPSLEALYGSRNVFLEQVRTVAQEMVDEGLLLEEDVDRVVERARVGWGWVMGG